MQLINKAQLLAFVVLHGEETDKPSENHRPKAGDHFADRCLTVLLFRFNSFQRSFYTALMSAHQII